MITGINLSDTVEYTLSDDKENPTVFLLGAIPTTVVLGLSVNAQQRGLQATLDIVRLGLKGWRNCPVEFKKEKLNVGGREVDCAGMDCLDALPANAITELANKILEVNKLSEQERKN